MNERRTTDSMTARTVSMTPMQPSPRALATRSLTAADRLSGEARHEALRQHFERFVPSPQRFCPAQRSG